MLIWHLCIFPMRCLLRSMTHFLIKLFSLVAQSCLTLCDPSDYSPPGFPVHGILQARILKWVAIPFSRGFSRPRGWTPFSCTAVRFFTIWGTMKKHYTLEWVFSQTAAAAAKSLQSCLTLCDPIDGSSPLGSPVPGILQARTLEWVAISFSNAWKWKLWPMKIWQFLALHVPSKQRPL